MCMLQTLQSEHELLVTKVDSIRDTAIEIITHSTRYSKTVEPLLTLLNQRWQEVTSRLKVWPHLFLYSSCSFAAYQKSRFRS